MWALIIYFGLRLFQLGVEFSNHGLPKCGESYNFFAELTRFAIVTFLLYEAGLFDRYI